eukprot:scaffold393545_cov49-Prasinocladus_malaysianus.AAC.1
MRSWRPSACWKLHYDVAFASDVINRGSDWTYPYGFGLQLAGGRSRLRIRLKAPYDRQMQGQFVVFLCDQCRRQIFAALSVLGRSPLSLQQRLLVLVDIPRTRDSRYRAGHWTGRGLIGYGTYCVRPASRAQHRFRVMNAFAKMTQSSDTMFEAK